MESVDHPDGHDDAVLTAVGRIHRAARSASDEQTFRRACCAIVAEATGVRVVFFTTNEPGGSLSGVPLRCDGRTIGMIDPVQADARAAAEEFATAIVDAIRARDDRHYREMFESIDEAMCVIEMLFDGDGNACDYRFLRANAAFERQTGLKNPVGCTALELVPDLERFWFDTYAGIARSRRPERFEHSADAMGRWFDVYAFPVGDTASHCVGVLFRDVSDRKRAESALAASEHWAKMLVEGVPQMVWRAVGDGLWTWSNPQWTKFTGLSVEQSRGLGWLGAYHPHDRDMVEARWRAAAEEGLLDVNARIRGAADGRYRWFQTRASPVRDEAGIITEWLGTSTDVDELERMQERQRTLVAELQHRVRNILAVVRSIFGRTVDVSDDLTEVADHFRGRLDSLARTQAIVTQTPSGLVELEDLVREELLSVGIGDGPDVVIDGPQVSLGPKVAESIGLAIHELTTNAVKYGALGNPSGRLEIRWSVNMNYGDERKLVLRWTEQGVPAVLLQPNRQGFGSELITEALPYRLGAETNLEFRGGGVRCTIMVPLPDDAVEPGSALEHAG